MLIFMLISFSSTKSIKVKNNLEHFRDQFHLTQGKANYQAIIDMEIEESDEDRTNIIRAYKAVCESMMAQYSLSPFAKMRHFKKGTRQLEQSIKADATVENIYLRLLVQLSAPRILNYHQNIEDDLEFFTQNIVSAELPGHYKKRFIKSLLASNKKDYDLESLKGIKIN